jgi:iron(III) transport system ATP-binding protein
VDTIKPEEMKDREVIVSIRPEEFVVQDASCEGVEAIIDDSVFLGLNTHYFVHLTTGEEVEIIQESKIDSIIPRGTKVSLKIKDEKINIFTEDGKRNLVIGVKNDLDQYKKD